MERLIALGDFIDRVLTRIGKVAAWAGFALIAVTIFDVVTRRFFVLGSTRLQELEWHFHVILFTLCIGWAYMKDAHVRIDILRERLGERAQWWIELLGCILFLLPYCALIIWFSADFWHRSWLQGECSSSATGLCYRWAIKIFVPAGFSLLALAGVAVLLRKIAELFGPPGLRRQVRNVEEAEAEHLDEVPLDDASGEGGAG